MKSYFSLWIFLLLCLAAAASGTIFEPGAWYESIQKPAWTPPNAVFPPVWTVLYILMGVAGWLIWREDRWGLPVALWCVQLGLNALWSYLFFGLHRPGLAFIEIVLLWLAIGATILAARRIDGLAALLLAPYWVWVSVAAALNLSIWQMNP